MKYLVFLLLFIVNTQVFAQTIGIVTPDPGCQQLSLVGHEMPGDWNSNYYVSGNLTGNDNCQGVIAVVSGVPLNPGQFAYGMFDASLIFETPVQSEDFVIDLSTAFIHLPIGEQVKVIEMLSKDGLVADITLKKLAKPSMLGGSMFGSGINNIADYRWKLIVKWYGNSPYLNTTENFIYQKNDQLIINQVFDDSDPNAVVQFFDFIGDSRTTYNPHASNGVSDSWASYSGASTKPATYHMGIIETSSQLIQNDRIDITLNWVDGILSGPLM